MVFGGENHRRSVIVVYVIDYRCGTFCYGAHVARENYENMVQFGAFWCIFDQMVS